MRVLLKWLAGIAASIIAGVVIYQVTHNSQPSVPSPASSSAQSPNVVSCNVAGAVFNQLDNRPIAGIEVHYFRFTRDPNEWIRGQRSRLATTGPDGRFSGDCSGVEPENFPLRLELTGPGWRHRFQSNEYVRHGESRTNINIYVPERLMLQP